MLTEHDGQFILRKSNGQVADVFDAERMSRLLGSIGIGHVRYPTAGSSSSARPSPSTSTRPTACASHTTGLTNADELEVLLRDKHFRHMNTTSDSELLLNMFAVALHRERAT